MAVQQSRHNTVADIAATSFSDGQLFDLAAGSVHSHPYDHMSGGAACLHECEFMHAYLCRMFLLGSNKAWMKCTIPPQLLQVGDCRWASWGSWGCAASIHQVQRCEALIYTSIMRCRTLQKCGLKLPCPAEVPFSRGASPFQAAADVLPACPALSLSHKAAAKLAFVWVLRTLECIVFV